MKYLQKFAYVVMTYAFIVSLCVAQSEEQKKYTILKDFNLLHVAFGGEIFNESFSSLNLNTLNNSVGADSVHYIRSTLDYFTQVDYGDKKNPKINFYSNFRFRYTWGSRTDTIGVDRLLELSNVDFNISGAGFNKHLLWMRESWFKFFLNSDLEKQQHFIQIGLIPFEVGRGISLGAAYDTSGFLGFTPGFAIDQYAPSVLLSFNLPSKNSIDFYYSLIESKQNSLQENLEEIRTSELYRASLIRGVGRQNYIVALRSKNYLQSPDIKNFVIEPYIIHQHAPDKKLEFQADTDTYLSTVGVDIEVEQEKLSWGIEGAYNLGEICIKPWDRNVITLVKQDDGKLKEQYSKVYDKDPLDADAALVDATAVNDALLQGSIHDSSMNGKEIAPGLFNAIDRFRPAQNVNLQGYFFVADVSYDYRPDYLKFGLGAGYFSGDIHPHRDMNHATSQECINQNFSGFIPLQSEYSGKRIRHFVMLNQGLPVFRVKEPEKIIKDINATPRFSLDLSLAATNIAFIGSRVAWNPEMAKKYEGLLATNIIAYWSPETPDVVTAEHRYQADNFLGTEINMEFSAKIAQNLNLRGYAGVLLPGSYYKNLSGTIIKEYDVSMGCSVVYLCDAGLSYSF